MARKKIAESPPPSTTHFVVERLNWRRESGTTFYRFPGHNRIASFDSADEAEAFRRLHEAKARATVNPFAGTLAPPAEQTSLPEQVFCDWLTDHGITPPPEMKNGKRNWIKWWEASALTWNDDQRAAVWDRLDRVTFYRVREQPRKPVAYAIVKVSWGYNDEWYYPGSEGGEVQEVYRSRERAESVAERLNQEASDEWTEAIVDFDLGYAPAGVNQFELEQRLLPGQEPFDPPPRPAHALDEEGDVLDTFAPDEVAFYEVIEIELGESI